MKVSKIISLAMGAIFVSCVAALQAGAHETPTAPAEFLAMENPVSQDDVDDKFLKKVGRLYKGKCQKCHGEEGDGQGSAAADIVIKPTAFNASGYLEGRKDGQLFWIVKEGSKGTEMSAFGPGTDANLSEEELWNLIAFMRAKFTQ